MRARRRRASTLKQSKRSPALPGRGRSRAQPIAWRRRRDRGSTAARPQLRRSTATGALVTYQLVIEHPPSQLSHRHQQTISATSSTLVLHPRCLSSNGIPMTWRAISGRPNRAPRRTAVPSPPWASRATSSPLSSLHHGCSWTPRPACQMLRSSCEEAAPPCLSLEGPRFPVRRPEAEPLPTTRPHCTAVLRRRGGSNTYQWPTPKVLAMSSASRASRL
jgi:hypothetical protein